MKIAVVIPCFRVSRFVLDVIRRIGPEVSLIMVVDDECPEGSGDLVESECTDPRVSVVRNKKNLGVGGATKAGISAALAAGAEIIVKVDGDGQHKPEWIPLYVDSIARGQADVVKGNRFYDVDDLSEMPTVRLIGNAGLSFLAKLSTGYWHCFDPTNGMIAIHRKVAQRLPLDKISDRYFFETDLLFRLNILRANIVEVPMETIYGDEQSGIVIAKEVLPFLAKSLSNTGKRVFYNYYLRNFNVASLELVLGLVFVLFGFTYGVLNWNAGDEVASPGTVMVAGLPVIVGIQMLIGFVGFDIAMDPDRPVSPILAELNQPEPTNSSNS